MYYEEKVIDGQLCYRTTPNGPWAVVEYRELVARVVRAERKVNTFDQAREALRLWEELRMTENINPKSIKDLQERAQVATTRALAAMEEAP